MRKSLVIMFALACICSAQARVLSLSLAAEGELKLQNKDTLTGVSGDRDIKVIVAKGASVYLKDAYINHTYGVCNSQHAGLSFLGDGYLFLVGNNVVNGFDYAEPGIYVPRGCTLRIEGEGKLSAASGKTKPDGDYGYGQAAGIGAGADRGGDDSKNRSCGNIEIRGGVITAKGGYMAAGIGGGCKMSCGNIRIFGGNITAEGGTRGAGIGAGSHSFCEENQGYYAHCGDIYICGGTVKAIGGAGAAGIGGGVNSKVGKIEIDDKTGYELEKVVAIKGEEAPYSVGKGADLRDCSLSSVSAVYISRRQYINGIPADIFEFPVPEIPEEPQKCFAPTELECISTTATSAWIGWEPGSSNQSTWYVALKRHDQGESAWNGSYKYKQYYELTGLQPNTEYDVRVLAHCNEVGPSDYSEVITFKTSKAEEAAPTMPEEETKQCSFPRYFERADVTQTTATFVWTPWYDSDDKWELRFSDGNVDNVKYITVTEPRYTFTGLKSNTTYAVRICTVCGDNDKSLYTSDLFFKTLATPADCKAPTDVEVADIAQTSVTVYWNRGTYGQNKWKVKYKKTTASTWYYEMATTDSHTITDLQPDTQYEVFVVGYCDDTEGLASETVSFKTSPIVECKEPANLEVVNIMPTEALVRWEPGNLGQTQFHLVVYANTTGVDYHLSEDVNNTSYKLTGLTPGAEYEVEVEGKCPDGSWSNWAGWLYFNTPYHEGIDEVQCDKVQSTKVLRDGAMYIIHNGKTYTAQGVEVK